MFTLNCNGKLLVLDKPLVMGIINATPDSFYKVHAQPSPDKLILLAGKMIAEGAAIVDIGGQSTRPGSQRISAARELERILPVIEGIRTEYPECIISVDTYQARVAEMAVRAGASIVNDISGGSMDVEMLAIVAGLKVPYICMHIQGTPETMQKAPVYDDLIKEVLDYFILKTNECRKAGIHDVIIDPGFGFGKSISHNFRLLKELAIFKMLGKPILAGLSRKGTIQKTLGITVDQALNGTTVLNTLALLNGASILRVHDVKEAKEAIDLVAAYTIA
ncbi:MAG: dihydropteroate synthase [Ferruginibacter sp.]